MQGASPPRPRQGALFPGSLLKGQGSLSILYWEI